MKLKICLLLLVVLATACKANPLLPNYLQSRTYRQASSEDDDDSWKELLLEIRKMAAATAINLGCRFDPSSPQFTQTFLQAYVAIAPNVDENESLLTLAAKIAAKVVNDLGCADGDGVAYNDPEFQDNFKAAYAVETLGAIEALGDSYDDSRKLATLMMAKYGCGDIDPNGKQLIIRYLSLFADATEIPRGSKPLDFYDRWLISQLIRRYKCGSPDPESEEFKTNFLVASLTVALA